MFDLQVFQPLLPSAFITVFAQCHFGAKAKKDTQILYVNSDFSSLQCACTHGRAAHPAVLGKTVSGQYATAELATYTPALNRAIAREIAASCVSMGAPTHVLIMFSGHDDIPENLLQF